MKAAGCRLLANPVRQSAMGIAAIFTHARYWQRTLKLIKKELATLHPQVVIPIDSSTVNLRIAAAATRLRIPVCYYVAPQVWASRPWRVAKIKAAVNTLCCVLPFEESYFRSRGIHAVYVGHPLFDISPENSPQLFHNSPDFNPVLLDPPLPGIKPSNQSRASGTQRMAFTRTTADASTASPAAPRIAIFPGSRKAEINAHMPAMLEILSEIKGRFSNAHFVAVAPSNERAWQIRHHLRNANTPVDIRVGSADAIIRWADLVLAKSGTATLQIARHAKPMIVLHRVNRFTWHILARFFINTRFISLVNILADRQLVPEFIPFYGSPLPVARQAIELLSQPERRQKMSQDLAILTAPLHPRDNILASDRVANEVEKLLHAQPPPAKLLT